MSRVTIDFETRSEVDLRKRGTWNYSLHPSTDPLCLAWKAHEDWDACIWWPDAFDAAIMGEDFDLYQRKSPLQDLYDLVTAGYLVEAHNAFFERSIWQNVMVPRYGAPPIAHKTWRCSMSLAAAAGWPLNLKDLGEALRLVNRKDDDGHRTMMTVSKPRRLKAEGLHWHEDGPRLAKTFWYCLQDVIVEEEAAEHLPELSADELGVWQLDQAINERGVYCDVAMCEAAEETFDELQDELNMELEEITGGVVKTAGQLGKLVEWLRSTGCMVGDLRRETVEWALDGSKCPFVVLPSAHRALSIRLSLSRSSVKKYTAMHLRAAPDCRIRDTLGYHYAHTGRWAGKGIQPQNYPADRTKWLKNENYDTLCDAVAVGSLQWLRLMYDQPATALALAARGALCASPGHELIVSDFSSVEARGLLWMARDPNLNRIRSGEDLYKFLASRIYGKPVELILKDSVERFVGKTGVLGLGYGMGWRKFQILCDQAGVVLSDDEAKLAVRTYRETFAGVPQFWGAMESQAILAVSYPGRVFRVNGGMVSWFVQEHRGIDYLCCELPSGRLMRYPRPSVGTRTPPWDGAQPQDALYHEGFVGRPGGGRKWGAHDTWGGTIVENVVQAHCRDLMAYAMLRAEAAGYQVVLSVHDELVCEVPEGWGSVKGLEAIMSEVPSWSAGMPIGAEGWRGKRYRK